MPGELEQRLERAIRSIPADAPPALRDAAVGAIPTPARRGRRRLPLVLALGTVAMLASAVTLYASPAARRAVGIETHHPHAARPPGPHRLQLPAGMLGIAVASGGRVWATAGAVNLTGARAGAAELSPSAVNLALGRGRDLVAVHMDGSGERVLRRTEGRVAAIAWAPNPIYIAYVVAARRHDRLHLIEGDGDHDRLLDAAVAAVRPAWSAGDRRLAYVSADGRVVVRDLMHQRDAAVAPGCLGRATQLAWGPGSGPLAAAGDGSVGAILGGALHCTSLPGPPARIAWLDRSTLAAASGSAVTRFRWNGRRLTPLGRSVEVSGAPAAIGTLRGGRLAVVLAGPLRVIEADAATLRRRRALLLSPAGSADATISVR